MKMVGPSTRHIVPTARNKRSLEVLAGKAKPDRRVKNSALRPNADRGKAVAVPRCCGQLTAATLMAARNAVQLPHPVRKEKKQTATTLIDPAPSSYAFLIGK